MLGTELASFGRAASTLNSDPSLQPHLPYSLRKELSLNLEFTVSAGPIGQPTLRMFLSLPPALELQIYIATAAYYYVRVGDPNSGPLARTADALPAEPSPGP